MPNSTFKLQKFQQAQSLLGATNGQLAQELGVSRRAVESWRSGINKIPDSIMRLLSYLLAARAREIQNEISSSKGAAHECL